MTIRTGNSIFAHSLPAGRQVASERCCVLFLFTFFLLSLALLPSVSYAAPPKRIISLAPNITEILFALGLGDSIAGVTSFCDYPEEAKQKPKIGGMSNPSLEAVVSAKPDVVVLTTDGNTKEFEERLRSLKIKTLVFTARRLSELPVGIRELGTALGVREKAEELAKETAAAIDRFRMQDAVTPSGAGRS
ncbi:MAG: ABC transporter substrate-binding protein, partial [Nitrospirae bacterium]|nr:ABC transporter substrate-binding protein [Nitrospirota bacterium]